MKISLDTNILIDNPSIVFQKDREFVISFKVIQELDNHKRNPDLKFAAQAALRNVWYLIKNDKIEVLNLPEVLGDSPDEIIIQDTKDANASLLSDDVGARLIAKAFGVAIADYEAETEIDLTYTGVTRITGTVEYEKHFVQIKELPIEEFNATFDTNLKENQYCIMDRVVEKNDVWWNHGGHVTRISQSSKPFRDAGIMDDPLDSEQLCALHAVFDNTIPLTVIDGKIGSGKTIISLMGALGCVRGQKRFRYYDKVYVTRPPASINRDMKLGYLPGDLNDKLGDWLGGIISNLKFLLEKSERDKKEEVASEVFTDYFEMLNLDSIQGVSLHNAILLVDEYQLLNVETLKMVLSRISEGSKVVLIGDTAGQTYGVNRANEGFKVLYKHLGSSTEMSFVKLENIYRSALAKFVEDIFE